MTVLLAGAALGLDWLLGEPRRLHPLVGFGRLSQWLEERLNRAGAGRLRGLAAVLLLLLPPTVLAALLCRLPTLGWLADILLLYLALGHRSLHEHAQPVAARLVSRDP